jgi:hypothetical protein
LEGGERDIGGGVAFESVGIDEAIDHGIALEITKSEFGFGGVWSAADDGDAVGDEEVEFSHGHRDDGHAFPLADGDIIGVGEADPRLAAADELDDDGVTVDEERLVSVESAAP